MTLLLFFLGLQGCRDSNNVPVEPKNNENSIPLLDTDEPLPDTDEPLPTSKDGTTQILGPNGFLKIADGESGFEADIDSGDL
mgnify:CR=1 FL=1